MDEQLAKYMVGDVNVMRADCIISREKINDKVDYVYVQGYDNGLQYYEGPQKRRRFKRVSDDSLVEAENDTSGDNPKAAPKKGLGGTGGKYAYTKIYMSKFEKFTRKELSFELLGFCLCLTSFIEWETGFLVIGRGKRRRYVVKEDLVKKFDVSLSTVKRYVKKLSNLKILHIIEDKYKLDAKFLAKGRVFNED